MASVADCPSTRFEKNPSINNPMRQPPKMLVTMRLTSFILSFSILLKIIAPRIINTGTTPAMSRAAIR